MISIIVAHANNNVIGSKNELPWYIPEDLKHFKEVTLGHPVIMGRNTYESIVARLGKPLPGRKNIIVSRTVTSLPGVHIASSLTDALEQCENEDAFIIGGAQLYKVALENNVVDKMYVTRIHADIAGDTYFPTYGKDQWAITNKSRHTSADYSYEFLEMEKA